MLSVTMKPEPSHIVGITGANKALQRTLVCSPSGTLHFTEEGAYRLSKGRVEEQVLDLHTISFNHPVGLKRTGVGWGCSSVGSMLTQHAMGPWV